MLFIGQLPGQSDGSASPRAPKMLWADISVSMAAVARVSDYEAGKQQLFRVVLMDWCPLGGPSFFPNS